MLKLVVPLVVVLAGGIAVACFLWSTPLSEQRSEHPDTTLSLTGSDALSLEERVRILERSITDERQARQLLQDELLYLTGEIESLGAAAGDVPDQPADSTANDAITETNAATRRARVAGRNSPEFRLQRLVDAGISAERAEWILQREDQLRLAQMEARYEAQRNGERVDYRAMQQAEAEALRSELGAADYERYLEGTGRSTSVVVGSVLDTSPAQNVGIQPGDEIVSYGGTRIYNMGDLNRVMLEGEAGETVSAQIIRDGVTMQVAVRRGPLGITAGSRGRL